MYEDLKAQGIISDDIWLNRTEDIPYFETDPALNLEMILDFGKKLRTGFYERLPGFVDRLQLIDKEELYPLHAGFCSRLAMTFDQGDYSRIDAIPHKGAIAEKLYRRSRRISPTPGPIWGSAFYTRKGEPTGSPATSSLQGLAHFPQDPQLNISLGISLMNLGRAMSRPCPIFLRV